MTVYENDELPERGSLVEHLSFLVQVAARAPSAHNVQPWVCRLVQDTLTVERDDVYALKDGDPTRRETVLSLAIFIETLVIAGARWGIDVRVKPVATVPDEAGVASLSFHKRAPAVDESTYRAIWHRHTNRGPYEDMSLPSWLTSSSQLLEGAEARAFVIDDSAAKARIGTLVNNGMATALKLSSMRRELANLTYWSGDRVDTGMALEALISGASRNGLPAHEWFLANVDPDREASRLAAVFAASPVLLVIATEADDPTAWLDAGRVACRLMLRAAREGFTHDISAAPVEIPTLSPLLAQEIDSGWRPQMLMRVGTPTEPGLTLPSVRRSITFLP